MKVVVLLVIVTILVLFVSHKIAGPIYRFEKSLEVIKEGDLTYRVKLRKGDEFIDIAQQFNQMIEKLHSSIKKHRIRQEELVQSVNDIKKEISSSTLQEDSKHKIQKELEKIGDEIRDINSEFNI